MEVARRQGKNLCATLCEIERGVFYATYFQDRFGPDTEDLPHYLIGRTAGDAKAQLEASARALGYETVIWNEAIVVPVFSTRTEAAKTHAVRRKPVIAVDNRRHQS